MHNMVKPHRTLIQPAELTTQNLNTLKTLERLAYHGTSYAEMQSYRSWQDVANYCECDLSELRVYLTNDWYALLAEHEDYIEFVDLASRTRQTPLLQIIQVLTQYTKPFIMDCRETTSYRIVKALERAGRIEISQDEAYTRGGETFHDIRLALTGERRYTRQRALNYI